MTLTHAFRRSVENSLQIQRITKNCVRYHWSVRNSWFIVIVLFYRTFLLRANADTSGLLDKFSCFWYTRLRTETPAGRIDVPVQLATKQNTRWMNWLVKEIKNKMKKKAWKILRNFLRSSVPADHYPSFLSRQRPGLSLKRSLSSLNYLSCVLPSTQSIRLARSKHTSNQKKIKKFIEATTSYPYHFTSFALLPNRCSVHTTVH